MGFSVSATFAILFTSALVAFGMLYTSFENTYISVLDASNYHDEAMVNLKNSRLSLNDYTYETNSNVSVYDITFNLTNEGGTLSPDLWNFIYDGNLNSVDVAVQNKEYVLPGEWITITVQNVPKTTDIHSLVTVVDNGCSLKIKWQWEWLDPNQTQGEAVIISDAWYCPLEG
ncbi:hypothetical protein [Palaeococcus sp. (in: euryarchaeotes)]|nr:MAG: hypothetical protein DRN39_02045 [Thermococci archaeon]